MTEATQASTHDFIFLQMRENDHDQLVEFLGSLSAIRTPRGKAFMTRTAKHAERLESCVRRVIGGSEDIGVGFKVVPVYADDEAAAPKAIDALDDEALPAPTPWHIIARDRLLSHIPHLPRYLTHALLLVVLACGASAAIAGGLILWNVGTLVLMDAGKALMPNVIAGTILLAVGCITTQDVITRYTDLGLFNRIPPYSSARETYVFNLGRQQGKSFWSRYLRWFDSRKSDDAEERIADDVRRAS